jgi:hypothetical protein
MLISTIVVNAQDLNAAEITVNACFSRFGSATITLESIMPQGKRHVAWRGPIVQHSKLQACAHFWGLILVDGYFCYISDPVYLRLGNNCNTCNNMSRRSQMIMQDTYHA